MRIRLSLAFMLAGAVVAAALAGTATAATSGRIWQGTAEAPFLLGSLSNSLELVDDGEGGKDLRLALTDVFSIRASSPAYRGVGVPTPRSVQVTDSGLLIADDAADVVLEVTREGEEVWRYRSSLPAGDSQIFCAQRFSRDGRDYTLIADRDARRVYAVDMAEEPRIVWQYGNGAGGLTVNRLMDPLYAQYYDVAGGVVVITDNHGAHRVIEVRYDDYDPTAAESGFKPSSIVADYGTPGVPGNGDNQLDKPKSAELLQDGQFLIADEDAARVTVVDPVLNEVTWQYGTTGEPGSDESHLRTPNHATRLNDGDTLICDEGNSRVLRVTAGGALQAVYDLKTMGRPPGHSSTEAPEPRCAVAAADGLIVVADTLFDQVVLLGRARTATVSSLPLDGGDARQKKAFGRMSCKLWTGARGTNVTMEYRIDGGKWKTCGSRKHDFPAGTVGRTITYRATLVSERSYVDTPILENLSITWEEPTAGGSGGGGGGDKPGGSGNSGQSGTYTYPSSAVGGTGTSGTGTGSGTSGGGTGSGAFGGGTGSVSSSTGAGATSSAESLRPPVQSSGSGVAESVKGYEVQGAEGVSGVPLRAEEGAQMAEPKRSGPPVPVVALLVLAGVVAAGILVPWPFVAAQIRRIAGFDHTRPTRFLPFRPLGGHWP